MTLGGLSSKFGPGVYGADLVEDSQRAIGRRWQVTGHDGIFAVRSADVGEYVETFTPQVLRFSAVTKCEPHRALNFGESKGMTFDRVLIFPHGPTLKWLVTGDTSQVDKSLTKLYVAITRARFSVAFVLDKTQSQIDATLWTQEVG